MKTKAFDCVEMKHRAQERIRRELQDLSRQEELEYWRKIADEALAHRETAASAPSDAGRPTGIPRRRRAR
jgi:hypothetical protein